MELVLNPPSIKKLTNLKRIQFKLVRGLTGIYHWTVHLPTQINKFTSKDEAKKNLAITVDRLMTGHFDLLEIDLTDEWERTMVGGYKHLRQLVNNRYLKGKRKKKRSRKKKILKRIKKVNIYANLSRAGKSRRKPKVKPKNRKGKYANKGRVR